MTLAFPAMTHDARAQVALAIPDIVRGSQRRITIDDMAALRHVDSLSVSPDGRHFAIFVRQGDPAANDFSTGWFVGTTHDGALTYVGDGGQVKPGVLPNGQEEGPVTGGESRWSPDGQWIAYVRERNGEAQLWRSRIDGTAQEQLTHNAADVREFSWSDDGRTLYFTAGTPRAEQRASQQSKARHGYQYNEDLNTFTDFMQSQIRPAAETNLAVWGVAIDDGHEWRGSELERAEFTRAEERLAGGIERPTLFRQGVALSPKARADGSLVWLQRQGPASRRLRVMASYSSSGGNAIPCVSEKCSGLIGRVWWSENGERVLFWRMEGLNESGYGFYAWSPESGAVSTVLRTLDDVFLHCAPAEVDHLICVRETPTLPAHLADIDFRSGVLRMLVDVNPEFRNIRLGNVERFEWDTPKFGWNEPGGQLSGLYERQTYGYILYPPNFDATKKYPVFIEPYIAKGFDHPAHAEHPLHVYAANGFVVLNLSFPTPSNEKIESLGPAAMKQLYAADLDFPHLTMLMESTICGLDMASKRGFIDERRVGIGGVSHGTFVPLYLMQKHDRIAAISISSPHWGPFQYYWQTRKLRDAFSAAYGKAGYEDWIPKPEGSGREFWRRIDIADHVSDIKAPILMQLADRETFALLRLIRHLDDENKPYDAYVFSKEGHIKWQPAHLNSIMHRNLDWFRFWLQRYEDPDPAKSEQYVRWRKLRGE